jgi:hypothetical protein
LKVAKQKIEIEVDVPDGYEVAEYRKPQLGESYLCGRGEINICHGEGDFNRLILRRVKQYREPVLPSDKFASSEFSDDEKNWVCSYLKGVVLDEEFPWKSGCGSFRFCRIEKEST